MYMIWKKNHQTFIYQSKYWYGKKCSTYIDLHKNRRNYSLAVCFFKNHRKTLRKFVIFCNTTRAHGIKMNSLFGIAFILAVSLVPLVSCACNELTVQEANSTCSVDRNLMFEELLGDEGDYPMVCSYFNDYLKCMNVLVEGCDNKLLFNYKSFQETYTRPPYRCRITPTYSGSNHIAMSVMMLSMFAGASSFLQFAWTKIR